MNVRRRAILWTLLLWLCVCIAGAFRFRSLFAGLVLALAPLAPLAVLFPNVAGFLAYFIPITTVVLTMRVGRVCLEATGHGYHGDTLRRLARFRDFHLGSA